MFVGVSGRICMGLWRFPGAFVCVCGCCREHTYVFVEVAVSHLPCFLEMGSVTDLELTGYIRSAG